MLFSLRQRRECVWNLFPCHTALAARHVVKIGVLKPGVAFLPFPAEDAALKENNRGSDEAVSIVSVPGITAGVGEGRGLLQPCRGVLRLR